MEELNSLKPDHLAITGDLVNIATRSEIARARHWLGNNCDKDRTSLVPGNHDAYVPGAFKEATHAWQPWISGLQTGSVPAENSQFPYLKIKGPLAIIGFSTSNATLPFRATGKFTKLQAKKGGQLLTKANQDGLFRVILIHHPPYHDATHPMKKMIGIDRFQEMISENGAELILHGHTHLNTSQLLEYANGSVNAIGISSASQAAGDKKTIAGFNIFDIEKHASGWNCLHKRYALQPSTLAAHLIEENQLY